MSPVLDHGSVTMVRHETCGAAHVERYTVASGRRARAQVPGDPVALARDPFDPVDSVHLIAAPHVPDTENADHCAPSTASSAQGQAPSCSLMHVTGLRFVPRARRGPLPDSFDL